jgi:hypothetical protein
MSDLFEMQFVVPEGELAELEDAVRAASGDVRAPAEPYQVPSSQLDMFGDQQFEPLTILTVAVSAAFVADRVSRIVRRHRGARGVVIDLTGPTARYIETEALDAGEVLVMRPDRTESFRDDGIGKAVAAVTGALRTS